MISDQSIVSALNPSGEVWKFREPFRTAIVEVLKRGFGNVQYLHGFSGWRDNRAPGAQKPRSAMQTIELCDNFPSTFNLKQRQIVGELRSGVSAPGFSNGSIARNVERNKLPSILGRR